MNVFERKKKKEEKKWKIASKTGTFFLHLALESVKTADLWWLFYLVVKSQKKLIC